MAAIGFDFDHTLGVDGGLERRAFFAYAAELGHPLDESDPQWLARIDGLLSAFRADTMSIDDAVAQFGAAIGAPDARGERWRDICYGMLDTCTTARAMLVTA